MAGPLLVGVEIGGTKLQVGMGRGDGQILAMERRTIRPEAGAQGILDQIKFAVPVLLARSPAGGEPPAAIGIGFGGPVDDERGVVIRSHQVEGWDGFDLAAWARGTLGVDRVAIRNDADTAGLGEVRFGAGAGRSRVFYVTVGSGIGGALILDGRIYRGAGPGAAEIGHLWIDEPGSSHHLEDIASGWAIDKAARACVDPATGLNPFADFAEGTPPAVDAQAVARAALRGRDEANSILGRATRAMGRALAHVVTLVGPGRIILGGGVSLMPDTLWLDPIRATLEERAFPPYRGSYDLVPASLGEQVVVHGALALAGDLLSDDPRSSTAQSLDPLA